MPSFSVLPGSGGFLFPASAGKILAPRWSLNHQPFAGDLFSANKIERPNLKNCGVRNAGCGILKKSAAVLAAALVLAGLSVQADGFADAVIGYNPGTNFSAGFTNAATS